ncbi:MAG: hypothetical protein P8X67_17540 [Syntrophobacterales bacterium]
MFLRQAQGRLPLRRTVQVRLRSNPAVPRDGCPVAHPSPRSRRLGGPVNGAHNVLCTGEVKYLVKDPGFLFQGKVS